MSDQSLQGLDIKEIVKILPHRYPFLLVDRILELDVQQGTITGQKNLTINEPFFQGHFPEVPLMPGVLIIEALAQTGGMLIHIRDGRKKVALLLGMNDVKFRYSVKPGDVLILKAQILHLSLRGGRVTTKAYVQEKLAAEAEISFALVDKEQI